MKYGMPVTMISAVLVCGCSLLNGLSNSCIDNKSDGSRICTMIDSNQNVTTRTIERNQKLFISTCSNGNCTEFKEVAGTPAPAATMK